MGIRDPGIFLTLDPGFGMEKIRIRDKHPGSAVLHIFIFNFGAINKLVFYFLHNTSVKSCKFS